MNARWYNSGVGRFMSEDTYFGTMTNPQTQNQYAYVMNNPVNMWDPSGNVPSWVGDEVHVIWAMNSEFGVKLPSHTYSLVDTNTHNSSWYLKDEVKTSKEITYYYESKRTKEWIYRHSYNYTWRESPSGNSHTSIDWDTETVIFRDKDYYYKTVVDTAEDRAMKNKIEIQRLAGNPPTDEDSPSFTISYENDKVIDEDEIILSKRENFNTLSDTEKLAVSSLQNELNNVLGKNLKIDGQYGTNTGNAIKDFQKVYNLPKTGVFDVKTFLQLEEAFREYKVEEFKYNQLIEYEENMYSKPSVDDVSMQFPPANDWVSSKKTSNPIIENFINDTSLGLTKSKKETMIVMGSTLLDTGYEPAFVAGVLGNILAEGTAGKFESSAYSNLSAKPNYLKYVDENYNYRNEFSRKNITEVGVEKTYILLKELERDRYIGKFGLGSVQWTGSRTMDLIECYIEVVGVNGYPTTEECLKAESMLIAKEFNGTYNYIYDEWLSKYSGKDKSAYNAGSIVCLKYEVPVDRHNKAVTRGNSADAIYKVMMGQN